MMNNNTDFVVTRHDVGMIEVCLNYFQVSVPLFAFQELLLIMLTVPLAIWSASCCCVVFISCCIKIDDWGHFRVRGGSIDKT